MREHERAVSPGSQVLQKTNFNSESGFNAQMGSEVNADPRTPLLRIANNPACGKCLLKNAFSPKVVGINSQEVTLWDDASECPGLTNGRQKQGQDRKQKTEPGDVERTERRGRWKPSGTRFPVLIGNESRPGSGKMLRAFRNPARQDTVVHDERCGRRAAQQLNVMDPRPRWLLLALACFCLPHVPSESWKQATEAAIQRMLKCDEDATEGESLQGPHEKRLLHNLLDHYNVLERPVGNESEPLQLSFGLTLMQIIDVDEKNQLLVTNIWLKLEWNDVNLRWNSSEYGGVKDLRIPPHRIWKPDVLMYNSADEGFDGTYPTNVVVRNNGSCLYVPPGIFKSTCKIDITWFPFDDQRCEMKFGSWTYDGFQLDLQLQDEGGGDVSSFITNGEWDLLGVPGKRNEIYYNCCPEPYIDITFIIIIRRRTLYYFFNLIVPCVLIASMAVLGFTLPPDSGEKLSLGVTILLSLTVFLNMVAETMPATSDAVPLLDVTVLLSLTFFLNMVAATMPPTSERPLIGVTILLSLTVFHNLVADTLPQVSDALPVLGVTILLSLSVFSLMIADALPQTSEAIPLLGTYFNCIMFMVASSVVSTILILNYHHRNADTHEMSPWIKSVFLHWLPWILRMSRPSRGGSELSPPPRRLPQLRELELKERSSKSLLANVLDIDDDFRHHGSTLQTSGHAAAGYLRSHSHHEDGNAGLLQGSCLGPHRELTLILKELRVITDKLRKEDEAAEITNDWKFAAMVVDRLCLIVFTLFTIIATIAVLFSAPHIIVT